MNLLVLGARVIDAAQAAELARTFLTAQFSQSPRHRKRLKKIAQLEFRYRGPTAPEQCNGARRR
jgi:ribose 5-phosphate isomerase RpiB